MSDNITPRPPNFWLYKTITETPQDEVFLRFEIVWLLDDSRVTHCCEITPSYELRFVSVTAVLNPDVEDEDCVLRYEAEDNFMQNVEDYSYEHCRSVTPHLVEKSDRSYHIGAWGGRGGMEKDDYEELKEEVLEHYRCNCAL